MDKLLFENRMSLFKYYIIEQDGAILNKVFDSSILNKEEGYKEKINLKFHNELNALLSSDFSLNQLAALVNRYVQSEGNNLVKYEYKDHFQEQLNINKDAIETLLYSVFCTEDDETSFSQAVKVLGRKYDLISFLFFLKNSEKYLPIKPDEFEKKLPMIGVLDFHASRRCSWENYSRFIEIMKSIMMVMKDWFNDNTISLLNAHSFVWMQETIDTFFKEQQKELDEAEKSPKKEKMTVTKSRGGQEIFRKKELAYWDNRCSVTGCKVIKILVAAHIKPWEVCKYNGEALGEYNGLLLTPNLHEAFDLGLISFDEKGKILISKEFKRADYQSLGIDPSMKLRKIESAHLPFLQYHRENIFKQ